MWLIYLIGVLGLLIVLMLILILLRCLPEHSRARRIGELLIALLGLAIVTALFWSY